MADIDNLSEELRRRRWKFIGNQIMIARLRYPGLQKGKENGADERQGEGGRQREKGKELDGEVRVRYKLQRLTGMVGGILC